MEVFQPLKIVKPQAFRVAAVEFALRMQDHRHDVSRDVERLIADARRIQEYLELGT
jgi:hypothetical protein